MEEKLPKNWVETSLGNLAQVQSGGTGCGEWESGGYSIVATLWLSRLRPSHDFVV